jgi:hypothetical protein
VTGEWEFKDYVRFDTHGGRATGGPFTFRVRLTQQGTRVTGEGNLTLSGELVNGHILNAMYRIGNSTGTFHWIFTPDYTRFEGAYTSQGLNGGTSYGQRVGVTPSSRDQATIFVVGHSFTGNRPPANSPGGYFLCFTVSRPSRVTIITSTTNAPLPGYDNTEDDGTGDCVGPYEADPSASAGREYRLEMRVDGRVVATDRATMLVTR